MRSDSDQVLKKSGSATRLQDFLLSYTQKTGQPKRRKKNFQKIHKFRRNILADSYVLFTNLHELQVAMAKILVQKNFLINQ